MSSYTNEQIRGAILRGPLGRYVAALASTWAHLPLHETVEQIEAHVESDSCDAGEDELNDAIHAALHVRAVNEVSLSWLADDREYGWDFDWFLAEYVRRPGDALASGASNE